MKLLIIGLLALVNFNSEIPLAVYKTDAAKSSIIIKGTSTLHDWEMSAKNMNGTMDVNVFDKRIDINSLTLSVPVESLKSGKSAMDNNAYKAMKSDKHKNISYKFTKVKSQNEIRKDCIQLVTVGELTIAGKTKTIEIPIEAVLEENNITLKGAVDLKMSSFGVEAPSFMFGSVTTGDDITIKFSINYR